MVEQGNKARMKENIRLRKGYGVTGPTFNIERSTLNF
jgi:hypothetical protein